MDIILQLMQVLTVFLLSPLLEGIVLQIESRVNRGKGISIFQPYRDLWKLFHKQLVLPEGASWIFIVIPIIAMCVMLLVPMIIPIVTNLPLPLGAMGDILGGGFILGLGGFVILLAGLEIGNSFGSMGSSRIVLINILSEPVMLLTLLIAWELMSLGGALMVADEHINKHTAKNTFLMLALLEVGSIALIFGMVAMCIGSGSIDFSTFVQGGKNLPQAIQLFVGILFVIGFGAKLGLLPFYEWFPGAYGSGSGATGALFSGLILNAALYAIMRVLIHWIQATTAGFLLGIIVGSIAVISAILATLYAFQQKDWRRLLSLSSAENASIAVLLISAALMARAHNHIDLAGMETMISLIHMAAHCLAKGCMFLIADGIFKARNSYDIKQMGIIKKTPIMAIGAVFASMNLAAIPPVCGYLSEWYAFELFFQGFYLDSFVGRLVWAFFAADLAISSAIALAVFIKAYGIGLLGKPDKIENKNTKTRFLFRYRISVFFIGSLTLALAIGMPWFIDVLQQFSINIFATDVVSKMHSGWYMIPLYHKFGFASPTIISIVICCYALIPLLLLINVKRFKIKITPIWYGGREPVSAELAAGNTLMFSNAIKKYYSFIYKNDEVIEQNSAEKHPKDKYFIKNINFTQKMISVFVKSLFKPIMIVLNFSFNKMQKVQSGNINHYNSVFIFLIILTMITVFL